MGPDASLVFDDQINVVAPVLDYGLTSVQSQELQSGYISIDKIW